MTEEEIIKLDKILGFLRQVCIEDDSFPALTINQHKEDPNDISSFMAPDCTKELGRMLLLEALARTNDRSNPKNL